VSTAARTFLRGLVIAGGLLVFGASLLAFRIEQWPAYLAYVLVSIVLFARQVEVVPNLPMPLPLLASTIGFLYIAGPAVIALQSFAHVLVYLLRMAIPARWRGAVAHYLVNPELATEIWAPAITKSSATEWATFSLGLAARWWIVSTLVPDGRPTSHLEAIAVAEVGGYVVWSVVGGLPIHTFRSPLTVTPERGLRVAVQDLALVTFFGLTPFVFLIAYGYEAGGLPAAVVWSLMTLGLHATLQRLQERRLRVEEQNRQLETLNRELAHRERLSAIGQMSSVVSHQMLQQLGVIGLHADLIRHTEAGDDPRAALGQAHTHAAAIETALGDVNRILTDLLVFSRDLRVNLYEHRLADVLMECVDECRPVAAERGVTVWLESVPDVTLALDKLKIRQAVVNLIRNAIDASAPGGRVTVAVVADGDWVTISVADTGPGIPETDRERVFAPFYTTKGHGTGLGLAIAREFTMAHGGSLVAEAHDGRGAVFVLRLPRRERPADPPCALRGGR